MVFRDACTSGSTVLDKHLSGLDYFFLLPPAINFNGGNVYAESPLALWTSGPLDLKSVGLISPLAVAPAAHHLSVHLQHKAYCCWVCEI